MKRCSNHKGFTNTHLEGRKWQKQNGRRQSRPENGVFTRWESPETTLPGQLHYEQELAAYLMD
eukprot:7827013-Prorocentrum_lima.AAC.1